MPVHGRELAPESELELVALASQPASEESGKAAGVEFASGLVVEPAAEPELVESAERALPPMPTDSATSQSFSPPWYTGSRSCTSVATAFVEP